MGRGSKAGQRTKKQGMTSYGTRGYREVLNINGQGKLGRTVKDREGKDRAGDERA